MTKLDSKLAALYLGAEVQVIWVNEKWAGYMKLDMNKPRSVTPQFLALLADKINGEPLIEAKLLLRPLSDMKEEEAIETFKLKWLNPHSNHEWISIKMKMEESVFMNPGWRVEAKYRQNKNSKENTMLGTLSMNNFQPLSFQYLLSKSFDLFSLIDSGLALDITKVKR